jgi:transposase InsO family protein
MYQDPNVIHLWPATFLPKPALLSKYERWRKVAKILKVSKQARQRLEWIIYYQETGGNASRTARYFGMSRKTFHKWLREFDEDNLYSLYRLEDRSRAPYHVRQREITPKQESRIVALRKEKMYYGKMKLKKLYEKKYKEAISSWKIQYVITSWGLYRNPKKTARVATKRKRSRSQAKKKLTELNDLRWYQKKAGYIICLDVVTVYWNGMKRYFFTAIDKYGKVAFAHMYVNKSSQSARDFLLRLLYLTDGKLPRVGHDNGSEFKKLFGRACRQLKVEQYWSRPRTPKDNPDNERFNRTLREEFLGEGNFNPDPIVCNRRLTEWLIEYNFIRPHESLQYQTPVERSKVLPMWSSCTLA